VRDELEDHVAHVYRLAMRLTGDTHRAEDLTQETFLRAWQRSQQLKDSRAARAWLFQIAINLMNDDVRKRNSPMLNVSRLPDDVLDSESSPDLTTERNEELEHALELLDGLPERQRMVLYLTAVEDFSLEEVCQILKISSSTAKANLSLARKRMREELAKRNALRK
jgi:RNA polymerase sigma-70 factor (ECF subfamily)